MDEVVVLEPDEELGLEVVNEGVLELIAGGYLSAFCVSVDDIHPWSCIIKQNFSKINSSFALSSTGGKKMMFALEQVVCKSQHLQLALAFQNPLYPH